MSGRYATNVSSSSWRSRSNRASWNELSSGYTSIEMREEQEEETLHRLGDLQNGLLVSFRGGIGVL